MQSLRRKNNRIGSLKGDPSLHSKHKGAIWRQTTSEKDVARFNEIQVTSVAHIVTYTYTRPKIPPMPKLESS